MDNTYKTIYEPLDTLVMSCIISEVSRSKIFEIDECSHVVVKGTEKRIAYLGDESVELVDVENSESRRHHSDFLRICDTGFWAAAHVDYCYNHRN